MWLRGAWLCGAGLCGPGCVGPGVEPRPGALVSHHWPPPARPTYNSCQQREVKIDRCRYIFNHKSLASERDSKSSEQRIIINDFKHEEVKLG